MHKRTVKRAIDARLSGLSMPAGYRAEVFRRLQGEKRIMKHKLSFALVMVIVLLLLLAGIALAFGGNLFAFFARDSAPLQYVAEHAQTVTPTETPQSTSQPAPSLPVRIDSTYFDGSTLYLAYRIVGGKEFMEPFIPTTQQLEQMHLEENMMAPALTEENPVMNQFITAYEAGEPFGYHHRAIGRSDHIHTSDGIDIPWDDEETAIEGEDLLCYVAFSSPLPAEVSTRDVMTLEMRFFMQDFFFWFDGEQLYSRSVIGQEYPLTVDVGRNGTIQPRMLSGSVTVGETEIALTAEVSPLYIRLSYPAAGDLEFGLFDPATGNEARAASLESQPDGSVIQVFDGLGTTPEALCAYTIVWQAEGGRATAETYRDQAIRLE